VRRESENSDQLPARKSNSITCVVSSGAGKNFHSFTRILAGLHEDAMAPPITRGAPNFSVRRDDDFDFDLAGYIHALGKFRIGGVAFCS